MNSVNSMRLYPESQARQPLRLSDCDQLPSGQWNTLTPVVQSIRVFIMFRRAFLQGERSMKNILRLFVLAAVMSFGWLNWTHASEDMVAAGSQTLKGDVLKIEGEYY